VDDKKPEAQVKITVLTYPGQPSFLLPDKYVASQIDEIVFQTYGRQPNRSPHNWRGDSVEETK
jgi:hypothetical protein